MPSLNLVQIIGHLGKDAELRYTPSGAAVSNFSVAATDKWKDKNGEAKEHTEWFRVTLWGKSAEAVSQFLTKGKLVYVAGRLETRKWDDNGVTRYSTEVKADRVLLLSHDGGSSQPSREPNEPAPSREPGEDDDLNF